MRLFLAVLSGLLLSSQAGAYIDVDWDSKKMARPSVPPAVHRPPLSASVLPGGQEHVGIHVDYLNSRNTGRSGVYPYDHDNQTMGGGVYSRTGLAPGGLELGGGVDYPFVVPTFSMRYQLVGYGKKFGPVATLEAGFNLMPDYFGGLALGMGLGEKVELWSAYRGGQVLQRGYSELSGGATLRAANLMDVGIGLAWRRYDTLSNEEVLRASVVLDFGSSDALEGDEPFEGLSSQQLLEQKRYKAAAQSFEDELEINPKRADLWKGYSRALEGLGMNREARKARLRALNLEAEAEPAPTAPGLPSGASDSDLDLK